MKKFDHSRFYLAVNYILDNDLVKSKGEFSDILEISSSKFSEILNKRMRPGIELYEKLSLKFDFDTNWLLTGQGDMLKSTPYTMDNNSYESVPAYASKRTDPFRIPLLPTEAIAGMSDGNVSIRDLDIQEFYTIPDFGDVDFMIRVRGSSMYPKYNSGDIIGCRFLEGSRFIQWNKVYVVATQYQGVLIKRIKPSAEEDCFTAISDNEKYDPFDIPKSEIINIALVIGVIRLE